MNHFKRENLMNFYDDHDENFRGVTVYEQASWGDVEDVSRNMDMGPAWRSGNFGAPNRSRGAFWHIPNSDWFVFPGLAGAVEQYGRNAYIDGCHSSILLMPPVLGDPCLNALYLIPNIVQTEHTHPSDRYGFLVEGSVHAFAETGDYKMTTGDAFYLPEGELHHFETSDERAVIIAYHPDSAWGPTDESHQMLDATIM